MRAHDADQPVGVVQATVVDDGSTAHVAWEIGVSSQGQGYASEAARAMIEWLTTAGVTTIDALIHPDHTASERVAERAGLGLTADVVDGERRWRHAVERSV